jgi:hypothetical protein
MNARTLRRWVPDWLRSWYHRRRRQRSLDRGNRGAAPVAGGVSFGDLVRNRREWLRRHLPPASLELHLDIMTKESQKRLARRIGLEVAVDHVVGRPLAEALAHVQHERLDRFVIKPTSSYSGIACHALVREGARYRDLRSGRWLRMGQLGQLLRRERLRDRDDSWLVEELLLPSDGALAPIADYKFYCFGGRVELIVHKRAAPGPKRYHAQLYDRDWLPVNVGLEDRDDPVAEAPLNGARLVATAERAAASLCYPFIRIDLYDSHRGIVLGEFTPGPGRAYGFNAEWNARLVRRWQEAEAMLEEGIRSGRITPLGAEPAAAVAAPPTPAPTPAGAVVEPAA